MRVAVINFCTAAYEMLRFSSDMLRENAGQEVDYHVMTWDPTVEVDRWLAQQGIAGGRYETNPRLDYLPNLRAMFNAGFEYGYERADYVCLVNTDMAFGSNWLVNLVRRANPETIPNSVHVTPIKGEGMGVVTANFGIPEYGKFQTGRFRTLHDRLYLDRVVTADQAGGWRAIATFPYILHRSWWERYGPWEVSLDGQKDAPDRRFFGRCAEGGARFVLCKDSICYHHEAVERRQQKPKRFAHLKEGK
jgi:hypothetical protein